MFLNYYLLQRDTPRPMDLLLQAHRKQCPKSVQKKPAIPLLSPVSCVQNLKHGSLQMLDPMKGLASLKGQPHSRRHSYRFEFGCE